jgi:hypothetical protein
MEEVNLDPCFDGPVTVVPEDNLVPVSDHPQHLADIPASSGYVFRDVPSLLSIGDAGCPPSFLSMLTSHLLSTHREMSLKLKFS